MFGQHAQKVEEGLGFIILIIYSNIILYYSNLSLICANTRSLDKIILKEYYKSNSISKYKIICRVEVFIQMKIFNSIIELCFSLNQIWRTAKLTLKYKFLSQKKI